MNISSLFCIEVKYIMIFNIENKTYLSVSFILNKSLIYHDEEDF